MIIIQSGHTIRLRRILSRVLFDLFIVNKTHIILSIYTCMTNKAKQENPKSVGKPEQCVAGLNDGILNHLNPPSDVFCMWRARRVLP